jgi:hypothetical protein
LICPKLYPYDPFFNNIPIYPYITLLTKEHLQNLKNNELSAVFSIFIVLLSMMAIHPNSSNVEEAAPQKIHKVKGRLSTEICIDTTSFENQVNLFKPGKQQRKN